MKGNVLKLWEDSAELNQTYITNYRLCEKEKKRAQIYV